MARPKTANTAKFSGRDRDKDIDSFSLEPLAEVPLPQSWYTEFQIEYFNKICKALVESRKLRSVDVPNVEIAAFWYHIAKSAMMSILNEGYLNRSEKNEKWSQVSAHFSALREANKMIQSFADRYGTNLTSENKIPKSKSDKNKLSEMFEPNN